MTGSSDSMTTHDLTGVLDVDALGSVRTGSTILVSGPPMSNKDGLAMDVLADGLERGQGAVVVTTGDHASDVVVDLRSRVDDLDETRVGVVDCRGEGDRSTDRTEGGAFVQHLASPSDMTGIGIGITKCMETLHNNGVDSGRFALVSLSTMLNYTDQKTVFKFCHVLSSRFDSQEYLGVFTIDAGAHDDQTLQVIKQAFDGMIEIREGESGYEARVLGITGQPTDWRPL